MGGVLSHTLVGIVSGLILYFCVKGKRWELFWAALLGNTMIDGFRYVIAAIFQGKINIFDVERDSVYRFVSYVTGELYTWIAFVIFVVALVGFLCHFHLIKKKTVEQYDEIFWAFMLGVMLHLILDMVYNEPSIWL